LKKERLLYSNILSVIQTNSIDRLKIFKTKYI